MAARVRVRTSSLYAHTFSGHESRRVLLDRFVALTTGNRQSRGQLSRKRRHSGLPCISGKRLKCARSPCDVFFDDRFVALATRKPSIAITSLVAEAGSNPTFRHGTSDDMRAFLSRNRGRVFAFAIYTLTRRPVPLVTSSRKWLTFRRTATGSCKFLLICT